MARLIGFLAFIVLARPAWAAQGSVQRAVEKGLRRIETGAASYLKHRQCFSCHHQAMPLLTLTTARRRGYAVDRTAIQRQVDFTLVNFQKRDRIRQGQGVSNGNTMAVYALAALNAAGHPRDETTAALVDYLLVRQRDDGSWPALYKRPPAEGSPFTNTALALQALRAYGPTQEAGKEGDRRRRVEKALRGGRDWLLRHEPETTEDKAWRLRGLVEAGVATTDVQKARADLLREQLADGSWAQLPGRPGDAYATGSVLVALARAGLPVTGVAYRKGVRYLLTTQKPDGSWLVESRSRPLQVFFDNGDPGGKSQFISFLATNWAVLALLQE